VSASDGEVAAGRGTSEVGGDGASAGTIERRTFVDRDGTEVTVPTYHGRPVLKEPAWTWEVPWYLFAGGLAGASSVVVLAARVAGDEVLADRARWVAVAGTAVSPPLLIADLGRPARFLNMLRVFKPTSVMSVGSWILAGYSTVAFGAAGLRVLERSELGVGGGVGRLAGRPREAPWRATLPFSRWVLDVKAAVFGAGMTVYTGALVADTAIPVWHEARRELPALFAASGLAAAGAAATIVTPAAHTAPARRAAVAGAVGELVVDEVMRRRLGPIGEVYEREEAGTFHRAARVATVAGAALVAAGGGRRRPLALAGSALLLAGSVCTRWSVYRAGFQSARDPVATLGPQRARLARGERTRARS
jgi:formate-dependent nitrite reductase membrane component NrfD